MNSVMSFGALS